MPRHALPETQTLVKSACGRKRTLIALVFFTRREPATPHGASETRTRYSAAPTFPSIHSVKPATSGLSLTSWRHTM